MTARGEKLFAETYGENAKSTRELLRGVHPDFGSNPYYRRSRAPPLMDRG
jgi:hypothetical protein